MEATDYKATEPLLWTNQVVQYVPNMDVWQLILCLNSCCLNRLKHPSMLSPLNHTYYNNQQGCVKNRLQQVEKIPQTDAWPYSLNMTSVESGILSREEVQSIGYQADLCEMFHAVPLFKVM